MLCWREAQGHTRLGEGHAVTWVDSLSRVASGWTGLGKTGFWEYVPGSRLFSLFFLFPGNSLLHIPVSRHAPMSLLFIQVSMPRGLERPV